MNAWDQFHEWLATILVAAVAWASGGLASELPPSTQAEARGAYGMLAWAQQADQPPIEQVGEETGDVETLDEGAVAPTDGLPADQESLDAEAAPASEEDVELLDQGAPPAQTTAPASTEPVSVAPASEPLPTAAAPEPAAPTGPVLPEGFGTGRVHASAGRIEFPAGLEDCHVGAVTGRAYAGLDCGEDQELAFVGHAPSFEAFPFVPDAQFPFEGDEAFFSDDFPFGDDAELAVAANRDDEVSGNVFVSARAGSRDRTDNDDSGSEIETAGESSVAFAQRARDREPRVRVDGRGASSNRSKDRDNGSARRDREHQAATSETSRGGVAAEAAGNQRKDSDKKDNKKSRNKDKQKKGAKSESRDKSESREQKAKDKKDKQKRDKRKNSKDAD